MLIPADISDLDPICFYIRMCYASELPELMNNRRGSTEYSILRKPPYKFIISTLSPSPAKPT